VGLLGPGLTGGPKIPRHQRSDEAPAREETVASKKELHIITETYKTREDKS